MGGKALELFRGGTTLEGEGRSKERKAEFLDHGCVVQPYGGVSMVWVPFVEGGWYGNIEVGKSVEIICEWAVRETLQSLDHAAHKAHTGNQRC